MKTGPLGVLILYNCVLLAPCPQKCAFACTCAHPGILSVSETDVVLCAADAAFTLDNKHTD